MAKDDYDVIVFKILTYLYSCIKRKITFNIKVFEAVLSKNNIPDEYLADILQMMTEEKLIKGLSFIHAWGQDRICISNYNEMKITADGIKYLKDNSKMNEVKQYLVSVPGLVADLINLVFN